MQSLFDFLLAMTGGRGIEMAAFALGLANIALLIRRSIWNYPFGIVMVALYAKIFFDAKLYSDAGLQVFFLLVQIYGWLHWARRRDAAGLVIVERVSGKAALAYGGIAFVLIAALGTVMSRYTDASYPYWDGSIAVLSVIAQVLLARRRLENWLVWIGVDALAIGLYWAKGLYPTAVLYGLFFVLAAAGYIGWRKAYVSGGRCAS